MLVPLLSGMHTVLSFVVVASDPGNITQETLIAASIEAGVKIFLRGNSPRQSVFQTGGAQHSQRQRRSNSRIL
jgi:hypothetical protein